jgi:cation transport regulator
MSYQSRDELPEIIRDILSPEAQDVYIDAYNAAWQTYEESTVQTLDRQSVAHRVAWDAVNREFVHDTQRGIWYRVGEEPVEEEQKGFFEKLRGMF